MCKRLIYLFSFFLVCGVQTCGAAGPEDHLVLHLPFDEGSGAVAADVSTTGLQATLDGSYEWTAGKFGQAVAFTAGQAVLSESDPLNLPQITIMAWVNPASIVNVDAVNHWQNMNSIYGKAGSDGDDSVVLSLTGGDGVFFYVDNGANQMLFVLDAGVQIGQWQHIAGTFDGAMMRAFLDGEQIGELAVTGTIISNPILPTIGGRADQTIWFVGAIDDVKVFDQALTTDEIKEVMAGEPGIAANPSPPDQATDVPREVVLSWTPGEFADQHDVYFGTSFDDVNNATNLDPMGADKVYRARQSVNSYAFPERLDFGKTYYWRIDEVNAPPTSHVVFKGGVWTFTVEPVAYAVENITATASSSAVAKGPENAINGLGLDDSGLLHGKDGDDNMWLSGAAGPQPSWIEFEFDKVYKLHEMWVWNYNEFMEPMIGLGFKDVSIEYSTNGADYTTLGTTHEFAQAPGTPDYAHNTTVDFGGLTAKYVRLTANSNWKGLLPQYGLSEVRFLHVPLRAREPSPDSGATDIDVDVTLSFRAGREAAQHDMYLSTDEQAVIDGNVPVITLPETSYGPLSLDLAQTHYWKINEVNMAETPTTLEGDVWNLTTREFLVVDDFESYNDLDTTDPESNRIFLTWLDGYGVATNGSIVGYANPPFAEQTIVHSGTQSMPLFYDNTGTARYSEAELTLSLAQDWTKSGVAALSLWLSGDPNNVPDQMYVKIDGSKVTYDGDAGNLTLRPWQPWNIDLASLGAGLQNVTKLSIGFGDETSMTSGGSGVVYVDDIRLYPYSRQLATPADPGPANLVAHYEFEGTASDSSGSGLHGTAMGTPAFAAGKVGQAISLDGLDDFVEITGYKGILGPNAVTVTAWINTSTVTGTIVGWGPNVDGQRFGFRINADRIRMEHQGGNVQGDSNVNDGQWHHVAVTVQESATISYPDVILYVNGIDDTRPSEDPDAFNLTADQDVRIGSRPASNDRFFMGLIDDVRIYDCALTQEEIAWLAGRTKPFDKPF